MNRSSGNRPRKTSNRKKFRGSQAKIESLEARMVMDAAAVYEAAQISFMGDDLVGKDGDFGKAGFDMALLYNQYVSGDNQVEDPDGGVGTFVPGVTFGDYVIEGNRIHVGVVGVSVDPQATAALMTDLADIGMDISASKSALAVGWINIDKLDELVSLTNVGMVQASRKPIVKSVGSVVDQADAAMETDTARTQFGVDGTGQKIGVISDTYNADGSAALDIATGDLPGAGNLLGNTTPIQVLYDEPGGTDEGRAMLQLVHDIAPGAELAFHGVGNSTLEFSNAIYNLIAAGSTVIVDDIGFSNEPFFFDGVVAKAADAAVTANVVYATAAGNDARTSWEGAFADSGAVLAAGSIQVDASDPYAPAAFFGGTSMDFDSSAAVDDRQSFTLEDGDNIALVFQWDQYFYSDSAGALGAESDLDLYLIDANGNIVSGSTYSNIGGDPIEFLEYQNTSGATATYELLIVVESGPMPNYVKYINTVGYDSMGALEYATNSGTAWGHANPDLALSVGAAFYGDTPGYGANPAVLEDFSSPGGSPILFDSNLARIAPVYRENVDVVGPDGADTTFFAPYGIVDVEGNGLPNFFGTSAAAPHVAALAALLRQANPELISTQVNDILRDTAQDMDDESTPAFDIGFDFATGYGFVDGVAAIELALNTVGLNPGGGDNGGGGGGEDGGGDVTPPSCGVYFGPEAVEVQAALGANLFVTGHAMLDNGVANGQLGYDYEVLDFLRGIGTFQEIPKSQYSIAVIGNSDADWGFSTGTQLATGYESTTFYDVDNITPALWSQILSNDALIFLSDITSVATGGLTNGQIDTIVDAKDLIAAAVNTHGLDVWANAGSAATGYYDILPTGAVDVAALTANATPFAATTEGQAIGITYEMANAAAASFEFTDFDSDLYELETRDLSEIVSLGATNIAIQNDELVSVSQAGSYMLNGVIGYKFNDANLDGIRQADEAGLAGFTFFIDEDGDGRIGLCEPSAVTDASGMYTLYPRYSGTFNVLQVVEPGYFSTDDVQHVISVNGSRITLNASLDSGAVVAIDYGDPGNPYAAHPVVDGFHLGESPMVDDGVVFGSGLKVGTNVVSISSSSLYSPGILQAWMDFNKDGKFNGPGEQIFHNLTLQEGTHNYTFVIPDFVIDDSTQDPAYRIPLDVRFRVDYTLNLGPTGDAFAGEVEDYEVFISQDADGGIRLNDDAFTYVEDTADQTFDVLANDSSFYNRALTIVDITDATSMAILDALTIVDNKIVFDATGIVDLGTDITFSYTVMDSKGFTETADVTLTVAEDNLAVVATASFYNPDFGGDVNNDGFITSHDLAIVLREIERFGSRALPQLGTPRAGFAKFIDVNGDNSFDPRDIVSILEKMVQNQIAYQEEGEAVDAAFVDDQPAAPSMTSPAAPLTLQTPMVTGLTATTKSSRPLSTTDISGYFAGVFEKTSKQSSPQNQQSTTLAYETETDSEVEEHLFSDNSFELQLIDSASSSSLMSEEVEATLDEIAIDVEAAWEEDLISG
ncbi:GEVED domain-containing protein [Blastopirellula marina]|uniref:Uncharacterized protein n=1 Tax=Blastopirellula marina DSM 3645 TaxID=314230 RepID=A4A1K3_9BACT|nr:GEVED domain-containing protein [Blastopirellula marina]EAQ77370.1 hypothetical protein DSM3645_23955 [Blastopirellula marina DSM 3645]